MRGCHLCSYTRTASSEVATAFFAGAEVPNDKQQQKQKQQEKEPSKQSRRAEASGSGSANARISADLAGARVRAGGVSHQRSFAAAAGLRPTTVKWGQCWVFAAVFTSIMRCLGFCTRTVIGMNSGLDVDLDGKVMGGDEFVWNFHVWAEVFVNGEWHCIDPTPRPVLEGSVFCAGPVPVSSVRKCSLQGHASTNCRDTRYFTSMTSHALYSECDDVRVFTIDKIDKGGERLLLKDISASYIGTPTHVCPL